MSLVSQVQRVFAVLSRLEWIPVLLARLAVGYEFAASGWGKLHRLDALAKEFASLGIPAPAANATLAASTEFIGGSLVLVGLGTRFAAAPLAFVMVVAIVTAKLGEVHDLLNFLYLSEPLFFVILVWLVFRGGGKASLDHLIAVRKGWIADPSKPEPGR